VIAEDHGRAGLSYDLFTRTTTRNHYSVAQELFRTVPPQRLHDRRDHAGRDRALDRPHAARPLQFEGTCPICGYDSARGDQCDNCGNQLDPIDLINPRSRVTARRPSLSETEHFFLEPAGAGEHARRVA